MQRAHAGERFLVTRRGKPYVRLIPATDQPPLAPAEDAGGREPAAQSPRRGMKDNKPTPEHISRYVEELVECGVQLTTVLDHMYRHENPDPDVPPPPEVLRDLVAATLAPALRGRRTEVQRATSLLLKTSKTIEREIFLVEPEHRNGAGGEPSMN